MGFIEASKTGSKGGGDGVPVGALMTFSGSQLPDGYEPAETEEQISIQQLNDNLTANNEPFKFAYDSNNDEYGYEINGEFKSFGGVMKKVINKTIPITSTATTSVNIDITSDYANYANIDISNIFVVFDTLSCWITTGISSGGVGRSANLTYTYSNGIITITSSSNEIPFRVSQNTNLNVRVVLC